MGVSKVAYGKVAAPVKTGVIDRQGWNNVPFAYLTGVMVLLTMVSIFHVWSRAEVIDLGLKISESSRYYQEEQQENKRLRVEVASLKAPARIEALAKGELGMDLPSDQQVIVIK